MTNRVAVDKPLTLRSVNGPDFTVIEGGGYNWWSGEGLNIRCVYLASGASLSGFTLTNGYAISDNGGGVWCESATAVISNCALTGNTAFWGCGGGTYGGTLNNCVLASNSADAFLARSEGGGAYGATLNHCMLIGNWASGVDASGGSGGGGAWACTLSNCILTGNWANYGGGVSQCTLYNSMLVSNSASDWSGVGGGRGGGAYECTLHNCTLTGNSASTDGSNTGGMGGGAFGGTLHNCQMTRNSAGYGGGASASTLDNCMLTGNWAEHGGGAAYDWWSGVWCTLNNCTLTANTAAGGGGVYRGTLNNCIVYFNTASWGPQWENYAGSTLNYCCTTPMPAGGFRNIDAAPLFVDHAGDDLRLRSDSPCIDAGTNLTGLITTDILGLPRPMDGNGDGLARFDIGAYEFNPYRFEPTLEMGVDGFRFTVRGEPGRSVRIERSPTW